MLHQLSLSLQFSKLEQPALHRAALARHKLARWIRHALECDAEITVRVVGAQEGRTLNRDYRHQDHATNVLTFAYAREPLSADLVLCGPVVAREARQGHMDLHAHYAHLIVHGVLHAQGWEHETGAADARAMEARETQILDRLGFADPYRQRVRRSATTGSPGRR